MGWLIDDLDHYLDLGPLGLYEDIDKVRPRARDSYMSYATENTDYLTEADIAIAIRFNPVIKSDIYLELIEKAYILLRI
jgi:hypothetical protein